MKENKQSFIKHLGLIPARSGSKGIPGKNLKMLAGKPLIQYTFESALASQKLDAIHLSSDCDKTIQLALNMGIEAPYKRPANISIDSSTAFDVIRYHLEWLKRNGTEVENVVYLQPTSPIRARTLIDDGIKRFEESVNRPVVAICECSQHPYEMVSINDGKMQFFSVPENVAGRQNYTPYYFVSGALYVSGKQFILTEKKLFNENATYIITSKEEGVDIDDMMDFLFAEMLIIRDKNKKIPLLSD